MENLVNSNFILILILLISSNSLALPGMSDISYDIQMNDQIFNNKNINGCKNKIQNDAALLNLGLDLEKLNCNSIIDPEKFCKCVSMISASGFNISKEDERDLNSILMDKGSDLIVDSFESFLDKDEDYKNILKMAKALGKKNECLFKDSGLKSKFSEDNFPLTFQDSILERMSEKILSDYKNTTEIPEHDLNRELIDLKNHLKQENPHEMVTSMVRDVVDSSDLVIFRLMSTSSPLNLFRESLEHELSHVINNEHFFSSAIPQSSEIPRQLEPADRTLLQNLLADRCHNLKQKISQYAKKDFIETVSALKIDLFNPSVDNNSNILKKLVNDHFSSDIETKHEIELMQKSYFNLDKMYCKERSLVNLDNLDGDKKKEAASILKKYGENEFKLTEALENANRLRENIDSFEFSRNLLIDRRNYFQTYLALYEEISENLSDGLNEEGKYCYKKENKKVMELLKIVKKGMYLRIMNGDQVKCISGDRESLNSKIVKAKRDVRKMNELVAKSEKAEELDREKLLAQNEAIRILEGEKNRLTDKLIAVVGQRKADSLINKENRRVVRRGTENGQFDLVTSMVERSTSSRTRGPRGGTHEDIKSLKNSINSFNKKFSVNDEKGPSSKLKESDSSGGALGASKNAAGNTQKMNSQALASQNIFKNRFQDNIQMAKKSSDYRESEREQIISRRERALKDQYDALETLYNKEKQASKVSSNSKGSSALQAEILKLKIDIEKQKMELEKSKIADKSGIKPKVTPKSKRVTRQVQSPSSNTVFSSGRDFQRKAGDISRAPSSASSNTAQSQAAIPNTDNSVSNSSTGPSAGTQTSNTAGSASSKLSGSEQLSLNGSSESEQFSISKADTNVVSDGRLVQIDFAFDSVPESERVELLRKLFLEGEEEIVLELPNGEKMIVKNNIKPESSEVIETQGPVIDLRRKKRHEDLKKLIDLEVTENSQDIE